MGEYQDLIQTLALTLGVAWASGINLYAAVTVLGLSGTMGYAQLPESLSVIENPLVITTAAFMYCVEFFADKTPGVDTLWDSVHTFIRVPAGAMLAAAAAGPVDPAIAVAAGLLGGSLTAASHATKAGSRLLINTSPEPFSNWTASVAEDLAVFAGLWAAIQHPVLFLLALCLFLLVLCWLLPKLWRAIVTLLRPMFRKIGGWFSTTRPEANERHVDLQQLRAQGILSTREYQAASARLSR
jgi:hypothetical protein